MVQRQCHQRTNRTADDHGQLDESIELRREQRPDPVVTLTATDPEGDMPIMWSLTGGAPPTNFTDVAGITDDDNDDEDHFDSSTSPPCSPSRPQGAA